MQFIKRINTWNHCVHKKRRVNEKCAITKGVMNWRCFFFPFHLVLPRLPGVAERGEWKTSESFPSERPSVDQSDVKSDVKFHHHSAGNSLYSSGKKLETRKKQNNVTRPCHQPKINHKMQSTKNKTRQIKA